MANFKALGRADIEISLLLAVYATVWGNEAEQEKGNPD
jgi:hypothetical protein